MAKPKKNTLRFWSFAVIALLASVALVTLARMTMPSGGQMTYAKYGCIPHDPSKREWGQYLGLSPCS